MASFVCTQNMNQVDSWILKSKLLFSLECQVQCCPRDLGSSLREHMTSLDLREVTSCDCIAFLALSRPDHLWNTRGINKIWQINPHNGKRRHLSGHFRIYLPWLCHDSPMKRTVHTKILRKIPYFQTTIKKVNFPKTFTCSMVTSMLSQNLHLFKGDLHAIHQCASYPMCEWVLKSIV